MEENILFILKGLGLTVKIYLATMLFSLPLGIILSLGRISKSKIINNMIQFYTWVFRGKIGRASCRERVSSPV